MPYYLQLQLHYECRNDFLEIRDGPIESSPLIGKYCGEDISKYINSTGQHLFVKFVSDRYYQERGFSAKFFKGQDI